MRNYNHGGARKGAGRKKGVGITYDIQKYCSKMIKEMLMDDAIRLKATKQLAMTFEKEEEQYLYIIENDGKYKIGYSTNWLNRKKNYNVHLPNFELIYLIKNNRSFELESHLHLMFRKKHIHGEWFDLQAEDLIEAIKYCSSIIENNKHIFTPKNGA